MRSKILSASAYLIIAILGITLSSIFIFKARFFERHVSLGAAHNQAAVFLASDIFPKLASSTLPIRLIIPKIDIDAPIEDVGTTTLGAMAVPKGPVDVAWFDLGPRPGVIGSAVIAGHEGWKDGIAAVFDNLHELSKGDRIYVTDEIGSTTVFVVNKIGLFNQYENASPIFISNDGLAHLNLITCEGTWNATKKSYSNRLVVFAEEEISTSSPQ